MEKKQSSVEWLENQLKERYSLMNSEPLFDQAKEMENIQKKEMYVKGLKNYDPTYLNEIYGGNNSEVTISNNKHECCTPKGKVPRYVDCVGCDKKPIEGATLSYAQAQKDSFNIMEKKQSSIEWYENRLIQLDIDFGGHKNYWIERKKIRDQAKAMHKEERFQDFKEGFQAAVESLQGANNLVQSKKLGGEN